MVGKILAERYELIEKIAEGGMARVYRGRDLVLKRTIAVKVLKDQTTGDAAFVRRFEREAQAAAALSHPHIVNIYDVGEQDGIYFMVMEYVEGINLKEYIKQKGRLPVHEALQIARQIAEAIDQAQAAGIVHRDIKPQNILFSRSGKVKVTDFGIAIAGDGVTVPIEDEIIGSVQYISPEQARGEIACKQSDLYSLGIVLYEMVTGRVPFSGEKPVSIAMKHIQEQIVPPRQLQPDLPETLERIILKAVQKDIADRYSSAGEFLEDLIAAEGNSASGAARNSNHSQGGFDDLDEEDDEILRPVDDGDRPKERSFLARSWLTMLKILLLMVFVGGLFGGAYYMVDNYLTPPEVAVPDVRGMSQSDAARTIREEGLVPNSEVVYTYDDEIAVGSVVKTDPPEGRVVRENREIDLYVSQGPEYIIIPDLTGRTEMEAQIILQELDLAMSVVSEYNEEVEKGEVFRQVPGESFPASRGEEVVVYVSQGRGPFELADLVGYSEQGAVDYLRSQDLNPTIRYKFAVGSSGHVIEQRPEPGEEVVPGQSVDLIVGE